MVAKKVSYQELIHFLQLQTGYSYFKTRSIVKELSKVLNNKVEKGIAIDCLGLFKVDFSIKGVVNSNSDYYSIQEQAKDISYNLSIPMLDVLNVLKMYYNKIKSDVESGFQVNVKSVGYLTPKEESDGAIYIESRISPQLKKPENADFIILDEKGDFKMVLVSREDIRLSIIQDEDLKVPFRIITSSEDRSFKYIDLKA